MKFQYPLPKIASILAVITVAVVIYAFTSPKNNIASEIQQEPDRIEDIDEIVDSNLGYSPDEDNINVYVFSDFDCPHCRDLEPRLVELGKNNDDVALYYVPYPALQRENGIQAALATLCADSYGYRQEFASYMAENWSDVNSQMIGDAYQLFDDISGDEWQSCLTDDAMRQKQNDIISAGRELNITSVPTTIIDGYVITGGVDYNTLEQFVEHVR